MNDRLVVNVATGRYVAGQERLTEALARMGEDYIHYRDVLPALSPIHVWRPYAFKAYALREVGRQGAGDHTLLWCDASIVPIRDLTPLWTRIERDGYWISRNGWNNAQWTADAAYQSLTVAGVPLTREHNREIPHVVATAFGISLAHPVGRMILDEYFRLASETNAFNGPWRNGPESRCGPDECLGHRHDQTALSVIAWRLGCKLTDPPYIFAYKNEDKPPAEDTILLAVGI